MDSSERLTGGSQVTNFYSGRHILITGATGYIGKALVEKLLRSCPQLRNIYLLMRPKKGTDISVRINDLLEAPIFDWLKAQNSDVLNKLVPVYGDVTLPDLGLSKVDEQVLIENVSVVFHSAATIRFDEPLKTAVEVNLLGTKRVLQLCDKMSKLQVFLHVSTAYCNCHLQTVEEEIYTPPVNHEFVINCVQMCDDQMMNKLTPKLIVDQPNTYIYTKALSEYMLAEQNKKYQIAIVRPSIVTAAWREPIPGWIDNLNGPTGFYAGASKGLIRSLLVRRNVIADFIPVDIVINFMIVVAWHVSLSRNQITGHNKKTGIEVYNCTSGTNNPIYWGQIEKMIIRCVRELPCSGVLWYPGGSLKNNKYLHWCCFIAFQVIPAYIADFFSIIAGKKPRLVKIQQKIANATSQFTYFATQEWKFINEKMISLYEELNTADREIFYFNINDLNWKKYMENYWLGVRQYILKDDPSNLQQSKKELQTLYWIHHITQFIGYTILFWTITLLLKTETFQYIYNSFQTSKGITKVVHE